MKTFKGLTMEQQQYFKYTLEDLCENNPEIHGKINTKGHSEVSLLPATTGHPVPAPGTDD